MKVQIFESIQIQLTKACNEIQLYGLTHFLLSLALVLLDLNHGHKFRFEIFILMAVADSM